MRADTGATAIGTITAIGGGTFRDAIILHKQPFWVDEIEYFYGACLAAAATFLAWPSTPSGNALKSDTGGEGRMLFWCDAVGLGAFAVIGAMNACRMCVHPGLAVLCGTVTATFGGLTRDVICGLDGRSAGSTLAPVTSRGRILHSNAPLYAECAMLGASCYMVARRFHVPMPARIGAGVLSAVALRYVPDCAHKEACMHWFARGTSPHACATNE